MLRELRWELVAPAVIVCAALMTAILIRVLMPVLARYALARPGARSSHRVPTPQGGGAAVVAVVGVTMVAATLVVPGIVPLVTVALVLIAMLALGVVGAIDDIVVLRALPRLICQLLACTAVLVALPSATRIVPAVPLLVERAILVIALAWFVNLVNFMDGLDWITVAEVIPVCAGIAALAILGEAPAFIGIVACVLAGGMLGFAPFNKPVASLFLGDVGSLPIGLILGWMLIVIAGTGQLVAAIVMPLYYLADATITLGRRLARGERVWEAHRTHFYQRATDNGYTVREVVSRVFVLNVLLVTSALASVHIRSPLVSVSCVCIALVAVGSTLCRFSRKR